MTRTANRPRLQRVALAALIAFAALPAAAQQQPGQPPARPGGFEIGEIHWYPMEAQCTFFSPERQAAFRRDDPDSWRFVFATMLGAAEAGGTQDGPLERGYVVANGLLRELEKNRAGPDRDGNIVTVWRSAGEPRINVNVVIRAPGNDPPAPDGRPLLSGEMTLFWSDRNETVPIAGSCGPDPA